MTTAQRRLLERLVAVGGEAVWTDLDASGPTFNVCQRLGWMERSYLGVQKRWRITNAGRAALVGEGEG